MNLYYKKLQKDAAQICAEAINLLQHKQQHISVTKHKDIADIATTADLAAEKLIISRIKAKYPHHNIYSEEMGDEELGGEYTWVIDPLDGTKEYAKGLSEFGCLVAVEKKQLLVAGAFGISGLNESYSTAKDFGAFFDNQKLQVSKTADLQKSFVGYHIPAYKNGKREIDASLRILSRLILHSYRVRPAWFDIKFLAWVARGLIDAHIFGANVNQWYDVAPGLLLVAEAGGIVTDMHGNPLRNRDLSRGVVASNGAVHNQLLNIIKNSKIL